MFVIILLILSYFFYSLNGGDIENNKEINTADYEEQIIPWNLEILDVKKRDSIKDDYKMRIAIVDSGINKEHEDLVGTVVKEFNVINKGEQIRDELGHGTAIAGIIAAQDNNMGIIGIAPSTEIYDVKVLDDEGKGNVDHFIEAIEWCIEEQIDMINISFGFQTDNDELKQTIDKAISKGIIIVASAGNNYGMKTDYPAKYENVISITSIDKKLQRSNFASRQEIDFALPGEEILTTNNDGGYSLFNGTSFATAHATGIIALILADYRINKLNKEMFFMDYLDDFSFKFDCWEKLDYGKGLLTFKKRDDMIEFSEVCH